MVLGDFAFGLYDLFYGFGERLLDLSFICARALR